MGGLVLLSAGATAAATTAGAARVDTAAAVLKLLTLAKGLGFLAAIPHAQSQIFVPLPPALQIRGISSIHYQVGLSIQRETFVTKPSPERPKLE